MKKVSIFSLILSLAVTLSLLLTASCALPEITLPTPAVPSFQPVPAPSTPLPGTPSVPINPSWTPPVSPSPNNQTAVLPNIADVVAMVKPSVVAINTEAVAFDFFNRRFTEKGAGSGWIIDSNGIIVTNNHVVEGATTISATLEDGRTFDVDAKKVFTDPLADLAIMKIDAHNLPALKVGNSAKMRVGDWVIAIGNALGQGIRATEGIISNKGVSIPVGQGQTLYDLIETSAAINPGNSGGPLVNLAGEVIGITSAKIAASGVEGMGYAISTETAIPIIRELVQKGYVTRPWMGVSLYTVDRFAVMRYGLSVEKGVLVTGVVAGSPAAKAGLRTGDVITKIDGKEVSTTEDLILAIRSAQIGQQMVVTYIRGTAENTVTVTLAESPRPTG